MNFNSVSNKKKSKLVSSLLKTISIMFCIAGVCVFYLNTYINKVTIEQEKKQTLIQTVQYNKSEVSSWIKTQISQLDLMQYSFQSMLPTNLTQENIFSVLKNSTENSSNDGVISDYVVLTDKTMISGDGWVPDASYDPTQNDYYIKPQTMDIYISEPYVDANTGDFIITISMPLKYSGSFYGVLARDVSMSAVQNIFDEYDTSDGSYLYLLDSNNSILSHINDDYETSDAKKVNVENIDVPAMQQSIDNILKSKDYDNKQKFFYAEKEETSGWIIGLSYPQSIVTNELIQQMFMNLIIFSVIIIAGLSILVIIMKKKFSPIYDITNAAQQLENGNFNVNLNVNSNDELGFLSECFQNTGTYLRGIIKEISYILKQLGDGNLTVKTTHEYRGEFIEVETAIKNIIKQMNEIIANIDKVGKEVSSGAGIVADNAQHLSENSMTQAQQVSQIFEDMRCMKQTLENNSERTVLAGKAIVNVSTQLQESGNMMSEMMKEMDKIKSSSNQIENIIHTIEDIAFQTNILALNAAVEAARAGTVGKGFAVVADEVRELANKSALAAKNTSSLIEASIETVERGASVAQKTEKALSQTVESINQVVQETKEIVKTSQSQSNDIDSITQTVSDFSTAVQSNTAKAQENASTSQEMSEQANMLKELLYRFNIDKNI